MKGDTAAADGKGATITEKPKDLYTELLKLDDLHKRGILTDAEFEAEKRKLLNPPKEEKPPDQ